MNISQSLMKDLSPLDVCPLYIKNRYVLNTPTENEDEQNVMFRGRYFEWHLLGATRDQVEPIFKPLLKASKKPDGVSDTRPQAQYDIDIIVAQAKQTLFAFDLDTEEGEKQLFLEVPHGVDNKLTGNLDWVTYDVQKPNEEICIIDVKYTETKYDDRWNGFADFESREDLKLQAAHYITLYFLKHEKLVPFYFFVFGKAGWTRVFKVHLSKQGVTWHEQKVADTLEKWELMEQHGFPAHPLYEKCVSCPYAYECEYKSNIPEIEYVTI